MDTFDVTIVLCTYNRAGLLRDTLASLAALASDGFSHEVVVVDNASTDETPAVIAEAERSFPVPLRGVREARAGVACARNRGIQEARGRWVAFFDDDQVADTRWLAELLAMARARGCRCVGGANRLRLPPGRPDTLAPACWALLSAIIDPPAPCRYSRRFAPGAGNLLIERSVFDEVGRFDEGLREAGEDADLYRRMWAAGIVGWFTPAAISYHVIPAYRLEEPYLRWKAVRNGGHLARRNWQEWGRLMFVLVLFARLGQAALLHLPRLWWARLCGSGDRLLGARCRLWRVQGYCRFAVHFLAPRLFAQEAFFRGLEFRSERELFPGAAAASATAKPATEGLG
jgi:glycosyltransferase involved in cell wall biosynthesis